jgi:hypothetical protein
MKNSITIENLKKMILKLQFPTRWTIMSNFERMQFYLSVGLNDLEIAERIGVHRVTVARWKKEIRERYYEYEGR